MATSRKRKSQQRKRPGAQMSGNPQVERVSSPRGRLRPFFKLMEDVTSAADRTVLETPDVENQLTRFDAEILVRGINSVKAVRSLLEHGHWEHAVGVTRQLFELLVNMEYLGTVEDRGEATLLFARFGLLQFLLAEERRFAYNREKGHPVNDQMAAMVDDHLKNEFNDFQAKPRADGSVRWVSSWCRKDTAELARLSDDPMRTYHYNILYRVWSEQAHAAPGALIKNMFRDNDNGWVEQAVAETDRSSRDTIAFTLMFFLRLWVVLPHVEASHERVAVWLGKLSVLNGGPGLPPRPWTTEEISVS
ncbi:DUF5677 domain-containing protein [Streptomyces sp. NPDC102405]|uniref:DUF5677 domain-containing protein n=1 Tax=Streptomyces sp. NPDC102405 TaxID=3366170 RepID=UPI0037F3984F